MYTALVLWSPKKVMLQKEVIYKYLKLLSYIVGLVVPIGHS